MTDLEKHGHLMFEACGWLFVTTKRSGRAPVSSIVYGASYRIFTKGNVFSDRTPGILSRCPTAPGM